MKEGGSAGSRTQTTVSRNGLLSPRKLSPHDTPDVSQGLLALAALASNAKSYMEASDWLRLGSPPKPWLPGGGKRDAILSRLCGQR